MMIGLLAPAVVLRAVLRLLPARLLAPLDTWAQRSAQRRARRRREATRSAR